jgi:hypothetical protein
MTTQSAGSGAEAATAADGPPVPDPLEVPDEEVGVDPSLGINACVKSKSSSAVRSGRFSVATLLLDWELAALRSGVVSTSTLFSSTALGINMLARA